MRESLQNQEFRILTIRFSIFKKVGVELDENSNVAIDENQQTNIQGVFAAGDVTGGLFQVVFAAAEGARAGINANKYLRQKKKD